MASTIDSSKPVQGNATTTSVRNNFAAAKAEIEELQAGLAAVPADIATATGAVFDALQAWTTAQLATVAAASHPPYIATAALTLTVTAGGSDAQTGQLAPANFATLAGAIAYAQRIDNAGFDVTINIPAATHQGPYIITGLRKRATLIIAGPEAYPYTTGQRALLTAASGSGHVVLGNGGMAQYELRDLAVSAAGTANNLTSVARGAYGTLTRVEHGATNAAQILAFYSSTMLLSGNNTVSGAASTFASVSYSATLLPGTGTITFTATHAYSSSFLSVTYNSSVAWRNKPKSGSATGTRVVAQYQSVVDNNAAAQNTIPGNADGTPVTGSAIY
jgi:hypothetical protein